MKFIIVHFASLLLFTTLISSAKVKNKQLFDVIQKTLSVQNTPSGNSIFGNLEAATKNKDPPVTDNSLFSPVNFNQVSERNFEKKKSSLFDANTSTDDPNQSNVVGADSNVSKDATPPVMPKKLESGAAQSAKKKQSLSAESDKVIKNNQQTNSKNKDIRAVNDKTAKIHEKLNAKKAAGPVSNEANLNDFSKKIKKEIEEDLNAEEKSENSPIKKVSKIKQGDESESKIEKADKEQNPKNKKDLNNKKTKAKKNNNNNNPPDEDSNLDKKPTDNNNEEKGKDEIDLNSEGAIEREIEKLKQQVKHLIEMNDALVKRLEKIDSKNPRIKIDKNIVGFVQKYDGKVKEIDSKLKGERKALSADLTKKEKSLKNLFQNTNLNFNEIKSQVKNLKEKLTKIEEQQNDKDEALKTGFEGDRLSVENNLNVKGITYSKKVSTNEINLQNVDIKENILKVGDNTQLFIGSESFDFSEVAKLLKYVDTIKEQCGENFELCKLVSNEETSEIEEKEKNIVENLKKLRTDTYKVLNKLGGRGAKKDRNFRR